MKGKLQSKAFIATIIATSLATILLLLWISVNQASAQFERTVSEPQPLSYSGYFFNNVFNEIKGIVGPTTLLLEENNTNFKIVISDSLPKNFNASMQSYRTYLESNVSALLHANVSLNTSNI